MKIKNASTILFSATGETKKVVDLFIGHLPLKTTEIDITDYSEREKACEFESDELVIFAVPVYGGRVPAPAVTTFENMKGNKTPAILIVTYGNREYDDALGELKEIVEKKGFVTVAAAAFVAEHSIMHSVANGRPDVADEKKIGDFAKNVLGKIVNIDETNILVQMVNGNSQYREYNGVPFKPHCSGKCTKCGGCAKGCPVNAISHDMPNKTDEKLCISCMRCIKICPENARKLNSIMLVGAEKVFAMKCRIRKEPEFFI